MENIKLYELEETYHSEKSSFEFPTVSYTMDTDKVWYMKNNQIKMMFSITEDDVNNYNGEDLMVWENSVLFDSVKVDGVEQKVPLQEKNVIITGETSEGEFMFNESCYINDKNIQKCSMLFDEPISEEKLIDADKYFLTMSLQWYKDDMWYDNINVTQPLSWMESNGYVDAFIFNEKSELVGLDLYYSSDGLVSVLGPTKRILAHVVYDENAVYDEENNNFIVNVNEDTLVASRVNYFYGGMGKLYLPTTEVKNYEVVATKYNDVTDMTDMFNGCQSLISLDLSSFDTSNVTDMGAMFENCQSLTALDLSNFDTSNVTFMGSLFYYCSGLTSIDLSSFDTSNVTNMGLMFYGCRGLTSLDLSNFNTSNLTNMNCMFYGCRGLTSLNLSNFDTSNVDYTNYMFSACTSLTSIIFGSQADVSKLGSSMRMFVGMFGDITTTGTLTYPKAYESAWNKILVTDQSRSLFPSTWTAVPIDYENGGPV